MEVLPNFGYAGGEYRTKGLGTKSHQVGFPTLRKFARKRNESNFHDFYAKALFCAVFRKNVHFVWKTFSLVAFCSVGFCSYTADGIGYIFIISAA